MLSLRHSRSRGVVCELNILEFERLPSLLFTAHRELSHTHTHTRHPVTVCLARGWQVLLAPGQTLASPPFGHLLAMPMQTLASAVKWSGATSPPGWLLGGPSPPGGPAGTQKCFLSLNVTNSYCTIITLS